MSDRPVNCYRCGGDGHFARNCPQCKSVLTQPTTPATLADSLDTLPATASKKPRRLHLATISATT